MGCGERFLGVVKVINTQDDFNLIQELIKDCLFKALRKHFGPEIELWDEHLPKFAELLDNYQLVEEPELRKLALDFLCESERDLCSCEILYQNNIYPLATYHFQQAVEKATKGYMWGFGFLNKDKETQIHESPKLFLIMLQKVGILSWLTSLPNTRLSSLMLEAQRILKKPNNPDIARWSYEEISEQLSSIDPYIKKIPVMVGEVFNCISESLNIKRDNLERDKAMLVRVLSSNGVLCVLSIIMLPHEAYTRYPDKDVKPDEYTAELGVIKAIPKMMQFLRPVVESLKVIISGQSK